MEDETGKERARRLREEIAKITGKAPRPKDDAVDKSLHERVEERMRELDRDKDEPGKSDK